MKRFFTLLALVASVFSSMAVEYTDTMLVSLDGQIGGTSRNTISVDKLENGGYVLKLTDFVLNSETGSVAVGNITIDASSTQGNGITFLHADQLIRIENGSSSQPFWLGPTLGPVPVKLLAKLTTDKLYAVITITFGGMNIKVQFGDGYQIPNSDFERFHTATASGKTSDEPNHWHSFMSSTGSYASWVNDAKQTAISTQVRPGTSGTKSVVVSSRIVFITVANGTMTTGQLKAGAMSASSTANNSFLDLTNTAKDANGDPFYTQLIGRPDSLVFWTKFKQGTPSVQYPYATATAVITDGTYYQQPEDKVYTNYMAKAENNKIESKGGTWQRLSIPFVYSANNVEPKAVLVTISTNATPGRGSGNDSIWIDDLSLIYNLGVNSISVKGEALASFDENTTTYAYQSVGNVTADDIVVDVKGKNPIVLKMLEAGKATIIVASDDLMQSRTYTLNITTGINEITSESSAKDAAVYDLNGVRVNNTDRKGVYIVKDSNGKTRKVVRK